VTYRKTLDRSPRLLSVQMNQTPGLYAGPGIYPGPASILSFMVFVCEHESLTWCLFFSNCVAFAAFYPVRQCVVCCRQQSHRWVTEWANDVVSNFWTLYIYVSDDRLKREVAVASDIFTPINFVNLALTLNFVRW